jgi:protein-disulfide isomerase
MLRGKALVVVAGGLVILALGTPAVTAQDTDQDLAKEIDALKKGQEQILKELQELKNLVASGRVARPSAPDATKVVLDIGHVPQQGDTAAKVVLVEFSDYQCPYCGRFARDTLPSIEKEYIDTGKIRYAFVDFPLESIHKLAFKAAEAAHCAGAQGDFWLMHNRLFSHQTALEPWSGHAEALGLNVEQFNACMESGTTATEIRETMALAQKAGIHSTPIFMLARVEGQSGNTVRGVSFVRGAQPVATFKEAIDKALSEEGKEEGEHAPTVGQPEGRQP